MILVLLALTPLVVRKAEMWYEERQQGPVLAAHLGVSPARLRRTPGEGVFQLLAADDRDRWIAWIVYRSRTNQIVYVAFNKPDPPGFSLSADGRRALFPLIKSETSFYYHEPVDSLSCRCADDPDYVICDSSASDRVYEAIVVWWGLKGIERRAPAIPEGDGGSAPSSESSRYRS